MKLHNPFKVAAELKDLILGISIITVLVTLFIALLLTLANAPVIFVITLLVAAIVRVTYAVFKGK